MGKTAGRVPIPAADQTWLHMDRPNNLMHVHSLVWFTGELDLDRLRAVFAERVVARHPVFRRRAVRVDGDWFWEDAPRFDLARHVRRREQEAPLDAEGLRAHVAEVFSAELPADRPLWEAEVIDGVEGLADRPVTVLFSRFHHAIADGIRLVQLMFSLCDPVEDPAAVLPVDVGRGRNRRGRAAAGLDALRHGVGDTVDLATGALARAPATALDHLRRSAWERDLQAVAHPGRLLDVVEALASEDNVVVNTATGVTRLLTAGRERGTAWSGRPGVAKGVAWVTDLDLGATRRIGRAHGGTVNDVLLSVVSRALTRYLHEQNASTEEVHWLVPVSLAPLDRGLPEALGNHFALVYLPMPLGIDGSADLVAAVRSRMNRLKNSAEPVVAFGLQLVVAEAPRALATRITNLFANKAVGVLTNVPGPRGPVALAGTRVAGCLGWAPTSGDEPLSLAIFSYDNTVTVGVAADAGLVPYPERIATLVAEEHAAMLEEVAGSPGDG